MDRATRRILIAAAAVLLLAAAGLSAARWAGGLSASAAAGKAHLTAGATALASMDATAALSGFEAATRDFAGVRAALGPDALAGVASLVPWAGRQYTTVRALASIGADVAAGGTVLSRALRDAAASGEPSGTPHAIAALLGARGGDVPAALARILGAADRASGLTTEGLLPPLARAVGSLRTSLGRYRPTLDLARGLLPVLRWASADRRILVISQDAAELRPTGGFIGSYGIVAVGPSGVHLEEYRDVYTLPKPSPPAPIPPGVLMAAYFSFRDANWWLDFPTSARTMLDFWNGAGQAPVDGIVAIDPIAMEYLLATTGPVTVPSFGETFTSQNLLDRLLYLVELKHVGKGVLGALGQELEQRVLGSPPAEMAQAAQALRRAADEKHLQLYFTDPAAEAAVARIGWAGRVALPAGGTDLVAVSSAMTKPGKVNAGMRKDQRYDVTLRSDRSADTTLVLDFANAAPFPMPLPSVFRDWLRVYRAPGTVFESPVPGGSVVTTTEFGLPAEVRTFTLLRGQLETVTMLARVPAAVVAGAAPGQMRYRLRIVRQADLQEVPTTVTVTVPAGWRVTGASADFPASRTSVTVTVAGGVVSLATPLIGDLELDVRLLAP